MITRDFDLWITQGHTKRLVFNANQYDQGETWRFRILGADGNPIVPTTAAIIGQKKDGHAILVQGTISDGKVVITETEQMTACAGLTEFELLLNGETHGTANFTVQVEKRPGDDADLSDSDLSLIQDAVDAAATIEDLIDGHDPDEVIADAVDAWLDAHPEATTTVEDGAITSAKLNDEVKTGVFEDMTVGTSLSVWNDEGVTDNLAYKFRQTGADAVRELDEVHGGTIAWNQLISTAKYEAGTYNGVDVTVNGDTVVLNGTPTNTNGVRFTSWSNTIVAGHVYLSLSNPNTYVAWQSSLVTGSLPNITAGTCLFKITTSVNNTAGYVLYQASRVFNNESFKPVIFDLTQMFGSTVADAIYAMEQSSAGSGVAYFRSLFPNAYYAYNAGELVSVEGLSAHVTTESNQFDPSHLLEATGWTVSNGVYSGKNSELYNAFGKHNGSYPIHGFKKNTQYTFEADFYSDADSTRQTIFEFWHTDGTYERTYAAYATQTRIRVTSAEGKTVECFDMSYGNTATIHLSNIMLTEGTDGTYKPYKKHTYPLDSTLTLRGVPKWNNGLYFDGDIYRHDGSVQRRYGIVDLGTLVWGYTGADSTYPYGYFTAAVSGKASGRQSLLCSKYTTSQASSLENVDKQCLGSAASSNFFVVDSSYTDAATFKTAMSGVYLVYELATPTSETADPYQQYQICDGKGTEEYVSETVTPVGHNTFYPVDIVAKVNKLPSDFSTLIAPTEEGFKATRNYTAKQFLIINNQLYRVTANIANGANIVPNTNVTAVTIADILTTLI